MINNCCKRSIVYKTLLGRIIKRQGRNNKGRITVRHRGGGVKKKYRYVDFLRQIQSVGKIESIHYDPNRSAMIAQVIYRNGCRKYIIHNKNMKVNDLIHNGIRSNNDIGTFKALKDIKEGTRICCMESCPGQGIVYLRSAGVYGVLMKHIGKYVKVRLRSGIVRLINCCCSAVIGEVGNKKHHLERLYKAGRNRNKGIRPTVRGVAMNPVDHPHGGGEGKTTSKRHPVSLWGRMTKGLKTRNNKRTNRFHISC